MDLQQSILSQTDVSLFLTKHVISAHGGDKNLVISPLSIHVLLSLLAAGSTGPTKHQLLCFLRSNSTSQLNSLFADLVSQVLADGSPFGGPQLSSANGVWVEQSFPVKPPFQEIVGNGYRAVIKNVDFRNKFEEVRVAVNIWAEMETKGLIKEMLPQSSVDSATTVILANAVYFKGFWKDTFKASETMDREFFLLDGTAVRAPFMFSYQSKCIRAFEGLKVLKLPYKQGQDARNFSMYMYLPDARDGLPSLLERFTSESGFIDRHHPYQYAEVGEFRIPKFKIAFGLEAKKLFKKIGLELLFDDRVCGLQEMVEHREGLYVSEIYHKAFIEVNEEGTEAAAVTVAAACFGCGPRKEEKVKLDFVADHPFLFVIREDTTGVVLFVGQVLNPLK